MKTPLTILFIVFSILNADATTEVNIKINSGNEDSLLIYLPSEGEFTSLSRKMVKTDKAGVLKLSLDLKQSGFLYLFPQLKFEKDDWLGVQIYLSPESQISVSMDKEQPDSTLKFSGDNESINYSINSYERHFLLYFSSTEKLKKLYVEDNPDETYQLMESLKKQEIGRLQQIKGINQEALEIVKSDINCYYNHAFYAALLRYGDIREKNNWRIKEDWFQIVEKYGIYKNMNAFSKASLWYETSIRLKKGFLYQKNREKYNKSLEAFTEIEKHWEQLDLILTDEELKLYVVNKLYFQMHKNEFNEMILFLYQKFKERFSDYAYFEVLFNHYEAQLNFQIALEKPISISNKNYHSLTELSNDITTEFIFVDIWATWCGPCIKEFSSNKNLKDFVDNHSEKITLVYLSVDEKKPINEIEKVINFHQLKGVNIVATKALRDDLYQKIGKNGTLSLPTYLLLKNSGEIIDKNTSRPSQWGQLKLELENVVLDKR